MAVFTLEIPDEQMGRVIPALSNAGGFAESSNENARAAVLAYISRVVLGAEQQAAIDAALHAVPDPEPLTLT